ncbi:MAG: hypothetical protein KJ649_11240 [Proteobacteria bacterium]|nr:hypothetical protein [Verrucomicrobiota bacterium]MBU1745455.1 hypothetical protein [Pseudomonadota bacterium]MBU1964890.1 hypothetical protein [Pseudomonadota bacterium]
MAPETILIDIHHRFPYFLAGNFSEKKEKYVKDYTRIARKITIVLFLSQSLSSAGFIAGAVDPGHMWQAAGRRITAPPQR